MTIPSFFIVIPTAFFVAILGVLLVRMSHQKTQAKRQLRKVLLTRIKSQPLPKLVQALGISFHQYFYTVPFEKIAKSVQRCETCASTYRCETKLADPNLYLSDMDFCQNKKHLSQFFQQKD